MEDKYFVIDIETCPLSLENYDALDEEARLKLLNPIDSKIIAIGVRHSGKNKIFMGEEKEILASFWSEWKSIREETPGVRVVGFNLIDFDIPFLVTRSIIHKIIIVPFMIKQLVDLRDKISAYRWGNVKGKLKDYALFMGMEIKEVNGSNMADLFRRNDVDLIKEYLTHDLVITDTLYHRCKETRVLEIERW